jgi:glycosyltransferase involved in cell wall biosynthesis
MKRVLVVITTSFVSYGGLTSVMMNYYRAMNRDGLQIDFASIGEADIKLLDELGSNNSKYFKLPARSNIFFYLRKLTKICRKYDIIHINGNSATTVIELLAAKLAGVKKRIHHNHSSKTSHPLLNKLLHPLFISLCTDAVACSDKAGEWLFGKGNFKVLLNAIDVPKYKYNEETRKNVRNSYGIHDGEFVIGHVGKMYEPKNHKFIVEVFYEFLKCCPNSRLLLVGDGELRSQIEKQVAVLALKDNVIFAGMRSDIPDQLQAMDVLLFPSLWEGLPLSVMEAQSSGLSCFLSENITKIVNVGEDVYYLSLDKNAGEWARFIYEHKGGNRCKRCEDNYDLITKAGLNINTEADKLRAIYLC